MNVALLGLYQISVTICLAVLLGAIYLRLRGKETENAHRESEIRLRELLASADLAAVILDTAGNITFCNEYLLQLTDWTADEVLGRNWFEVFIPAQEKDSMKILFADAIAGNIPMVRHEKQIITRHGKCRQIQWTNAILHDPDGRVAGSAILGKDVTEYRELEERYRQAQKLESVGGLAGGMAHDFNNLLNVINGYSEMALETLKEGDPLHSDLKAIRSAGERASALAQQLLVPSSQQVLQLKPLEPKMEESSRKRTETILVVDDESSIRLLFRRVLEGAGYEVVEAANGKAAMSQVRQGKIDLIITDLVMPEQEGVETIQQVRRSYPQIKVVAISGAFGGTLLKTAELLGAQATLTKPISPAKILQVTRDLLRCS